MLNVNVNVSVDVKQQKLRLSELVKAICDDGW